MINPQQRQQLLSLARESIVWGLQHSQPMVVDVNRYDPDLSRPGASFVTLHLHGNLRGCIGSLEAHQALVRDICDNAFSAAFRDPRFNRLQETELKDVDISISVLTPATAMTFDSEADLLSQLRPGVDGLILKSGFHKGTFLPAVWEQLPDANQFLQHLKRKAGLDVDYWSDNIQVSRYQTQSFSESSADERLG